MKIRKGKQSGTLDNAVFVNNKYGQVVRSRPRRQSRKTSARLRCQASCSNQASRWRNLSDARQAAWRAVAGQCRCRSTGKEDAKLSGCQLFVKINCALAAVRLEPVLAPPKPVKFGPNPVKRLVIRNEQGRITLELWLGKAPAAYIVVRGSPPCSRGILVRSNYSKIGLLTAPVRGHNEITAFYVERFGVPPVGSCVFIRTRQMIGGWEDDFKDISAVVPRG